MYAPAYLEFIDRYNEGDFRGCVEPLESLYFAAPNNFDQGLLQYVVALHQIKTRGIAPRFLLCRAAGRLAPYAPVYRGLEVGPILAHIAAIEERLPPPESSLPAAVSIPPLRLSLVE
jgi:hypothetical protein